MEDAVPESSKYKSTDIAAKITEVGAQCHTHMHTH